MSSLRLLKLSSLALLAMGSLSGCYVRARPGYYGATYTAQPTYVAPQAQPAQPVYQQPAQPVYQQPVCGACVQGTREICNGCDDNCNGVVDENCVR